MKKAAKLFSFLFLVLLLGSFYQGPANGAGGVPLVEDGGKGKPAGWIESTSLLNAGIDALSRSLMERIATKYFHAQKKPSIKIAVFDFTDEEGNITEGSRYLSNRIRLAFGSNQPFELLPAQKTLEGMVLTARNFDENYLLRERMVDELGADVYLLGTIRTVSRADLVCRISLWGTVPPQYNKWELEPFPQAVQSGAEELPEQWKVNFTKSGLEAIRQELVERGQDNQSPRGRVGASPHRYPEPSWLEIVSFVVMRMTPAHASGPYDSTAFVPLMTVIFSMRRGSRSP